MLQHHLAYYLLKIKLLSKEHTNTLVPAFMLATDEYTYTNKKHAYMHIYSPFLTIKYAK